MKLKILPTPNGKSLSDEIRNIISDVINDSGLLENFKKAHKILIYFSGEVKKGEI